MGLPIDNEEGYAKSNVINQIHALKSPLLLMHGMADDNVLFTHSTLPHVGTPKTREGF